MAKSNIDKSTLVKFQEPASHQENLDKEKEKFQHLAKVELAKKMREIKLLKDNLDGQLSAAKLAYEALQQLLVTALDDADENSFKLSDGWQFIQVVKVGASVIPEQREEFYQWIRDTNRTEHFTINPMTAAKIAKDLLEEGKEAPWGRRLFEGEYHGEAPQGFSITQKSKSKNQY